MSDYGAYLTTTDGRGFITDDSIPINLLNRYQASGAGSAIVTINIDNSMINIPFVLSDSSAFYSYSISGSELSIKASMPSGNNSLVNMSAYVFSTTEPQLPSWGVALWNSKGRCILTNETRVLRDIKTIGTKGEQAAGTEISATISGKWAILPDIAGYFYGTYQQRPLVIPVIFYARYDGSNTIISSSLSSTPPPGAQGSITNSRNSVKAIDASLYE